MSYTYTVEYDSNTTSFTTDNLLTPDELDTKLATISGVSTATAVSVNCEEDD